MMTHFKAHQGIHRVSTKSHTCPICNLGFPKQLKLNEHLAAQHNTCTSSNSSTSQSKLENSRLELLKCVDSFNKIGEGKSVKMCKSSENIHQSNATVSATVNRSLERSLNIQATDFLVPLNNSEIMEIKKEESLSQIFN